MDKPQELFYCDTCGQRIEDPSEGYVIWNSTEIEGLNFGWRIVHRSGVGPKAHTIGCVSEHDVSMPLTAFTGPDAQAYLLSFLDVGRHIKTTHHATIRDVAEFAEFMRRFNIPHYEEARLYWDEAEDDGFFDDAVNETGPYEQSSLKALIERYGP